MTLISDCDKRIIRETLGSMVNFDMVLLVLPVRTSCSSYIYITYYVKSLYRRAENRRTPCVTSYGTRTLIAPLSDTYMCMASEGKLDNLEYGQSVVWSNAAKWVWPKDSHPFPYLQSPFSKYWTHHCEYRSKHTIRCLLLDGVSCLHVHIRRNQDRGG